MSGSETQPGWLRVVGEANLARGAQQHEASERAEPPVERVLFERMARTTPDLLFIFDLFQRRVVYANRRLEDLFGLAPEAFGAIPGDQTVPLIHPDDLATSDAFLDGFATARDDEVRETEHRVRHRDGTWRWVRVRAVVYARDESGRPRQISGVTQDITPQKQAELALRDSEVRYRQLADAMPHLVWTSDADGLVDYYNSRAALYDGLRQTSAGAWTWQPIIHPDDLPATLAAWQAAQQRGAYQHEHRLRMADGSYRWHLSRAEALRDGGGLVVRWFGTATDTHERKQAEVREHFLYQLLDSSRRLSSPEAITALVVQRLGEHLGVDRCTYAATEADQDHFTVLSEYTTPGTRSLAGRFAMASFGAEALRLMRVGRPYVVEDSAAAHEVPDRGIYEAAQIAAVICVPLHKEGRFAAGMAVHQRTPRHWTADEVELVQLVANLCWEAVARARAERELRVNEERYRSLAHATTSMVWTADAAGEFVEPQEGWEAYTGQPWSEHRGRAWTALIHPEDRAGLEATWARALAERTTYEGRGRLWHTASQSYRICVARATPVFSPEGAIREWIGTITDIHEQKRAERAAEQARLRTAQLQRVTAALSEALTPADVGRVIVEHGVVALGAALGSLRLLSADGAALVDVFMQGTNMAALETWRTLPMDSPLPLTDAVRTGAPVWIETLDAARQRYPQLVPLMEVQGYASSASLPLHIEDRVIGGVGFSFAAPHSFNAEDRGFLLALAQQCAQALERARLYEAEQAARAEAEAAVRARDQFLSVAAHELRTPLTSLLGNAQLIQRRAERAGRADERELRSVRVIAEQAARLNRMVMALLDISRIETGQLAIVRAPVDLGQLLLRIADEIRPTLDGRTIDVACPDAPLVVSGDELRLEQVFQNLIQNAVKYSPAGDPVHVGIRPGDDAILVDVVDHGIGIPPQALPLLFQRFYRAHNVDPQQVSGMGIGLYVVKEIVALHGGSVEVRSAEGAGSTFTVRLPREP